ncbi:MAG: alpha/beta hydrolase [Micavibrio aeruginosavorus]|uniref:Alpha/beta hydrolase n=1 Tax=Micavibrio aeruginosavorus TaxID=349221 RepID=A0A2W5FNT8_9BACT|nr:MAG: alpha/beta hydrolase [Micavibrio aeruginosavorus]
MTIDHTLLFQKRFSQPDNWRWHHFKSATGHKIRFGSVFPKDKIPEAVVVCLPGFREFGEKYFELAHDMLERNIGFWVIDWAGQGQSDRLLPNDPLKVHSLGIEKNVQDLDQFLNDYVKPAAVHPDVGRLPVFLIGHSMGAHIGLRFMHKYSSNLVRGAAFSAPLVAIRQFARYPAFLVKLLSMYIRMSSESYIPGGEKMAELAREAAPGTGFYSSDPDRDQLHRNWFMHQETLRVNGPTYGWLAETLKSCLILQKKSYLRKIELPVLIATAEKDFIVSSKATKKLVSRLPNGELLELPDAQHEIFMERDDIRNKFLAKFDEFIHRTVLSREDRLKKF